MLLPSSYVMKYTASCLSCLSVTFFSQIARQDNMSLLQWSCKLLPYSLGSGHMLKALEIKRLMNRLSYTCMGELDSASGKFIEAGWPFTSMRILYCLNKHMTWFLCPISCYICICTLNHNRPCAISHFKLLKARPMFKLSTPHLTGLLHASCLWVSM